MPQYLKHFYEFADFRVDPQERVLFREGKPVPLTPKLFDTLLALVEHRNGIISRDDLLKFVWPDSFVEEGNLTQNISMLRKLLGENPEAPQFIETVPRRGYRFVAEVKEVGDENLESTLPKRQPEPEIMTMPALARRTVDVPQAGTGARQPLSNSAVFALLLLGILGLAFWVYRLLNPNQPPPQALSVNRLTYTGKASRVALSPDGKYVVQAVADAGRQSLWLRQVAVASEIEIVPPAAVTYISITFSADGNYLYFVRGAHSGPGEGSFSDRGTLYKMPVLGKGEKKLLENVDGHIALSPDGEWLAFVRQSPQQEKSALLLARTDGTGEKELATRKFPDNFQPGGPAWSPDGKLIACSTNNFTADNPYRGIVSIRVADGRETPLGSKHWLGATRRLAWLRDGSGLLVLGAEYSRGLNQIWQLAFPGNEAHKIISDLNDYADLSLTADAKMLAVVRADRVVNLWVAPDGDASRAKAITSGTGREDAVRGLTWTPDGRIVYRSMAGEAPQIWITNADGTNAKQLTADGNEHFDPALTPDGRAIVWSTSAAGPRNIWRMNLDGGTQNGQSGPQQITHGNNEWHPEYTPDGKWLVYVTMPQSLAKIPAAGGTPVRLTNGLSWRPTVSPDSQWIAYNRLDEASGQWQIAVIPVNSGPINGGPIDGGAKPKIFDAPSPSIFRALRWTPDGKSVAYPVTTGNVSNIWSQPLAGGPPRQLTNFKDQLIFDFAWSRDGKHLALSRGIVNSDVVIISNIH